MAKKKDRERFSIKFNAKDKSHKLVIDLLEEQPPRGKAQYIVNAILHYINCPETPDMFQPKPLDKNAVKSIVLEILDQQNVTLKKGKTTENPNIKSIQQLEDITPVEYEKPYDTMTDDTLSLIADTLSAFRSQ